MIFETTPDDFLRFLPTYLTNEEKGRLNQALKAQSYSSLFYLPQSALNPIL